MKIFKLILLILSLYIYLYNPILKILGFGSIKILLIVSILYLVLNKSIYTFLLNFKTELIFTIILILYSFPITYFGDSSAVFVPYQHFTWFIECFFISAFILFYFQDLFVRYSFEFLIVIVGTIASMITLYLIINPSVNEWMRESVLIDALDTTDTVFDYRGFTFAETSSFAYGIIQGLVFAFCLNSLRKSALYAIPIIPLFISILFNARIGFSAVFISIVLLLIFKRLKFKTIFVGLIIFIFGSFFVQNSSLFTDNDDSLAWGFSFFKDTFSVISGRDTSDSNYDILFNEMLVFPNTIHGFIFGEGRSAYGVAVNSSDIGYINEILTGGVVYLLIIMFFMHYLYRRNLIYTYDKYYTLLFIFVLLVVNVKGIALFVPNGFFRLFIFFYIYCIYFKCNYIEQTEIK